MRPTDWRQLPLGTKIDRGYRVKTAKVVMMNRPALERDFEFLRPLSNAEVEAWILENFAYVNENQLRLTGIRNTPILIDENDTKNFYVSPGVGRGAMVDLGDGRGLVDLKASGNSSWNNVQVEEIIKQAMSSEGGLIGARARDHSSGLEIYNLAAAEYLRQSEIQASYDLRNRETKSALETVESYFLIDYGFKIFYPNEVIPAFLYGRQAGFGRTAQNERRGDEIYTDKGHFQETYTRSRIDFGGSRTEGEKVVAYHDIIKHVPVKEVKAIMLYQERNWREHAIAPENFHPKVYKKVLPHRYDAHSLAHLYDSRNIRGLALEVSSTLTNVSRDFFERRPHGGAIGRSAFDIGDETWFIDVPYMATLKWMLFQLQPQELAEFLDAISVEARYRLYRVASNMFQMPLPLGAYTHKFKDDEELDAILTAAVSVFDRYPELVAPTVKRALHLFKKSTWAPNSVLNLIKAQPRFLGYDEFAEAVAQSQNEHARELVLEQRAKQCRAAVTPSPTNREN